MANDASEWSQYSKRVKPTYSDPSDDQRSDAAMPAGTASKTMAARTRQTIWSSSHGQPQSGAASSTSATSQETPREEKLQVPLQISSGATSSAQLMSIDEMSNMDEQSLMELSQGVRRA